MRGPAELIDNLHPIEGKARLFQLHRIAGKGDRIARNHRNRVDVRYGQRGDLRLRTCAGRVNHSGVKLA